MATAVLGQPDFVSNTAGLGPSQMGHPYDVLLTPQGLYVSDNGHGYGTTFRFLVAWGYREQQGHAILCRHASVVCQHPHLRFEF